MYSYIQLYKHTEIQTYKVISRKNSTCQERCTYLLLFVFVNTPSLYSQYNYSLFFFQTLLELTRKLESGQKSQYSNETVLSQLRKMVADRERRRGKSFSDTDSFTSQNASMLLHHIERYNSEVETENEENSLRLRQVTKPPKVNYP